MTVKGAIKAFLKACLKTTDTKDIPFSLAVLIYWAFITSTIEALVIRAIYPMSYITIVKTGKVKFSKVILPAFATPLNSFNQDERMIVNKIPLTNGGTEVVIIEKTDKVRSVFDPSLMPEIMPINNEIGMVRIKTQNIRIAVCPNLGHTTSFTGFLKCVEYPKSPVNAFPSHSEY